MLDALTIVRRELSSLQQDPNNARRHGRRNLDAIKASLVRFGQRVPLVVRPGGLIVGGNGTFSVMRRTFSEIAAERLLAPPPAPA